MRRNLFVIALLFVVVCGWFAVDRAAFHASKLQYDFVAFYCGSRATLAGQSAYYVEPLRSCEHGVARILSPTSPLVVPDPLPPFELAALAPIGIVPFRAAAAIWLLLTLAAIIGLVSTLRRMTGLALSYVVAATALSVALPALQLGQLVAFSTLGVALASYGLWRESRLALGLGFALALLEPHIALPAIVAAFVFAAKSRLPIALIVAIAVALSALVAGWDSTIVWLRDVVPVHVASELDNREQYSLSYLLRLCNVPPAIAASIGTAQYYLACTLGIIYAGRLAKRRSDPALLVLVPAAIALIGGPYLHVQQFAMAVPLALYVRAKVATRAANLCVAALAVPWGYFYTLAPLAPLCGIVFAYVLQFGRSPRPTMVMAAGTIATLTVAACEALRPEASGAITWPNVGPNGFPEELWRAVIENDLTGASTLYVATKMPTWVSVIVSLLLARQILVRRRPAKTNS